jgi:hypothetical protein
VKQNITLAIDKRLLKQVRAFAAQRGVSVSAMLAGELLRIVDSEAAYEKAMRNALAHMERGYHLGGQGIKNRDALHDRKNLR